MKTKVLICTLSLLSLLATTPARAASHTWSGAVNNAWSQAGNWSAGGAPQFGEANIVLIFPPGAVRYAATNGVGNYAIDEIIISGSNYSLGGYGVTLTGVSYYNLDCSGANNLIALDMTLNSTLEYFTVATNQSLTLSGVLSGPGGFTKFGPGRLILSGTANNTYTSPTTVVGGWLDLAKSANVAALPGAITVGTTASPTKDSYVRLLASQQIPDSVVPTVYSTGELMLNGFNETVAGLNLQGGRVDSGAGLLTLLGNVVAQEYDYGNIGIAPAIDGRVSLGGADRTFQVTGGYKSDFFVSAHIEDGGNNAGFIKTGDGGMDLFSSNSFAGVTTVSQGHLTVWNSSALGSTSSGTVVASGANLWLVTGCSVWSEPLTISGNGDGLYAALQLNSNCFWGGPITLTADTLVGVYDSNSVASITGTISGPGALHKVGPGTLTLAGGGANNYTGGTYVDEAVLCLGKSAFVAAVPGPLFIGVTNSAANSGDIPKTNQVRLLASQQIADNAPIFMQAAGLLDLNGYNETVGELTMIGSTITNSGGGVLTLNGNVQGETPWNNAPTLYGNVSLGGATRTFTTLSSGAIILPGVVSDGGSPAGIIKMGTLGGLRLDGTNNTYSGVTTVNEGWLSVEAPGSLGSPAAGTVVGNGALFYVGLNFHGPVETLTLNDGAMLVSVGYNSWDGNIVLNGNAQVQVDTAANNETLDLNGVISGPGSLTFILGGTLRLGGSSPNTYAGTTTVLGSTLWNTVSTLELRKPASVIAIPGPLVVGSATNPVNHEIVRYFAPNQIADNAPVTVNASGLFDLNNQYDGIGSLAGSGNVNLLFGALTVGANNTDTTLSGSIGGVGFVPLTKEGTGSLTLTGTNTCSGKMVVNNGHLYVNGSQTCNVELNPNGRLHGQGTVGVITGLGGWTVPGDNCVAPSHGQLKSATLNLDATSDFNVDLGGTASSGKYDRLKVTGTVTLANAILHITQSAMAKTNDQFVIIDNDGVDPVNGTFAGFPENSIINLGPAQTLKISYVGGDGNDVVLTQIAAPPAPTLGGITSTGNGQIQLTGSGVSGWTYSVLANDDLLNPNGWQTIGTATADGTGTFQFNDPDAPNHSQRFYRLQAP